MRTIEGCERRLASLVAERRPPSRAAVLCRDGVQSRGACPAGLPLALRELMGVHSACSAFDMLMRMRMPATHTPAVLRHLLPWAMHAMGWINPDDQLPMRIPPVYHPLPSTRSLCTAICWALQGCRVALPVQGHPCTFGGRWADA